MPAQKSRISNGKIPLIPNAAQRFRSAVQACSNRPLLARIARAVQYRDNAFSGTAVGFAQSWTPGVGSSTLIGCKPEDHSQGIALFGFDLFEVGRSTVDVWFQAHVPKRANVGALRTFSRRRPGVRRRGIKKLNKAGSRLAGPKEICRAPRRHFPDSLSKEESVRKLLAELSDIGYVAIIQTGVPRTLVLQSTGQLTQRQLKIDLNNQLSKNVKLTANYVLNNATSNTDGTSDPTGTPDALTGEFGRSTLDIRNNSTLTGAINAPWGLTLSPFIVASSNRPFNIISDLFQDTYIPVTDRPTLALNPNQPGVVLTRFGAFLLLPSPGDKIIARNYGIGIAFFPRVFAFVWNR